MTVPSLARVPLPIRTAAVAALLALYAVLLLGVRFAVWHDALMVPAVLVASLALLRERCSRAGTRVAVLGLVASAVLALGLAYVWSVGFAGRNHVFAGTFALSDAGEYYADAERVLHGAVMNSGGTRRPLFSAVLAGVLRLVGNDVRIAHGIMLLFWGFAGAFAASELWRTHGPRAGGLAFVLFVLFARRYVGFVQSEGLGGPLGAIAFGLVWRARSLQMRGGPWERTYLGGLLLQTIALLARPGPVTLLAGLLTWAAMQRPRHGRLRLLAASHGVIALAVLFQLGVRHRLTNAASYSDLPPILYGLLHGADFRFVWSANPALLALPVDARSSAIWALMAREILAHPSTMVVAPLRCLASWFVLPQGFFGFVWLNPDDRVLEDGALVRGVAATRGYLLGPLGLWVRTLGVYSLLNAAAMALGAAAFLAALVGAIARSAKRAWASHRPGAFTLAPLATVAAVSLGASLPFLPPWITEGAQIFAGAFVYVVAFVALSFIPECLAPAESDDAPPAPFVGPAVALVLVGLVVIAGAFPRSPSAEPCAMAGEATSPSESKGRDGAYLADVDWTSEASYGGETSLFRAADVVANLAQIRGLNRSFADAVAGTLHRPNRLVAAYDACRQRFVYVVDATGDNGSSRPSRRPPWTWLRTVPLGDPALEERR